MLEGESSFATKYKTGLKIPRLWHQLHEQCKLACLASPQGRQSFFLGGERPRAEKIFNFQIGPSQEALAALQPKDAGTGPKQGIGSSCFRFGRFGFQVSGLCLCSYTVCKVSGLYKDHGLRITVCGAGFRD